MVCSVSQVCQTVHVPPQPPHAAPRAPVEVLQEPKAIPETGRRYQPSLGRPAHVFAKGDAGAIFLVVFSSLFECTHYGCTARYGTVIVHWLCSHTIQVLQ